MARRAVRVAFLVGAALALLSLGPLGTLAGAQQLAAPALSSPTTSAGGGNDVSGGGCAARVSVQIQLDGVLLVTTTSSSTGTSRAHLILPVSTTPGTHQVTIVCAAVSGQVNNSVPLTVELPRTGANLIPLFVAGLASVMLGVALVRLRPRARRL
jgi:hypothetical protein